MRERAELEWAQEKEMREQAELERERAELARVREKEMREKAEMERERGEEVIARLMQRLAVSSS